MDDCSASIPWSSARSRDITQRGGEVGALFQCETVGVAAQAVEEDPGGGREGGKIDSDGANDGEGGELNSFCIEEANEEGLGVEGGGGPGLEVVEEGSGGGGGVGGGEGMEG